MLSAPIFLSVCHSGGERLIQINDCRTMLRNLSLLPLATEKTLNLLSQCQF